MYRKIWKPLTHTAKDTKILHNHCIQPLFVIWAEIIYKFSQFLLFQ